MKITGAEAIIQSLIKEKVDTVFGYPGGANIPIYDALYNYSNTIKHVLVRHEQGAVHAAEGYARANGKVGVCLTTSGPGATNLITGIANAMMDSTPLVCITGQVTVDLLGSDAFQETDVIGITTPITKWNYQITQASEIAEIFAQAFYIARQGRPGPVVIDITKNAQIEITDFKYSKIVSIPKYENQNNPTDNDIAIAAQWINSAKKPYIIAGHGVLISQATNELIQLVEKCDIPIAVTLHGLSSIPVSHQNYMGMVGMHGNLGPNILTNYADLIIALGMRFDDRVTGRIKDYAKRAKIIHVDIDESEFNKNVKAHITLKGDVKYILQKLLPHLKKNNHTQWKKTFSSYKKRELKAELIREKKKKHSITMKDVIKTISQATKGQSIIVADVGQNQMFSARYYKYKNPNSYITSGGLGTMGFSLPASIGVQIAMPKSQVIAIIGDGGFQMNIQEMATITQEQLPIKIVVMNNEFLGMVRQWQELFFSKRYSFTPISAPDFVKIADAYNIKSIKTINKENLKKDVDTMLNHPGPFLLEVKVYKEDNIFPMIPANASIEEVRLSE